MRASDFLYETINIICEKTTADELIPYLKPLGFEVQKKTGNTVKVVVPAVHRLSSVQQIAGTLPGATISSNGKEVHFDGSKILVKPAEAQGGRLEKEEGQIIALDSAIKEHLNGKPFVKLVVGTRVVNAAGVAKVPGNVKADAEIVDDQGNPVAWISLKDGNSPRGFGQWGGVNHLARDPEIMKFVSSLKAITAGGEFPRKLTYGALIKNPQLKALSSFGKDYGGSPGRSNVDLILQGHPTLKKGTRGSFVLTGAHTWHNGDIPAGEYEPVLTARYSADRSDFGIAGARITAFPTKGRPWQPVPAPAKQPVAKKTIPAPKQPALAVSKPKIGAPVQPKGTLGTTPAPQTGIEPTV